MGAPKQSGLGKDVETRRALCSLASCPAPARDAGMCSAHYQRLKRYGDPTYTPWVDADPIRLFLSCIPPVEFVRQMQAFGTADQWHRWLMRLRHTEKVLAHQVDQVAIAFGAHLSDFDPYYWTASA